MNITLVMVALGLLTIASLAAVSILAKRQRDALFRYQRGLQYKRTAEHFEDLAIALAGICVSPRVPALLQNIAVKTLERVLRDSPNVPNIAEQVAKARRTLAAIQSNSVAVPLVCLTPSELSKAQKQVAEGLRILRAEHRSGEQGDISVEDLSEELQWSWLQLEVRSHMRLAELAEERGDRFGAFSHYKQAQQKLMHSQLREIERTAQLRELAEILSGPGENTPTDAERQMA